MTTTATATIRFSTQLPRLDGGRDSTQLPRLDGGRDSSMQRWSGAHFGDRFELSRPSLPGNYRRDWERHQLESDFADAKQISNVFARRDSLRAVATKAVAKGFPALALRAVNAADLSVFDRRDDLKKVFEGALKHGDFQTARTVAADQTWGTFDRRDLLIKQAFDAAVEQGRGRVAMELAETSDMGTFEKRDMLAKLVERGMQRGNLDDVLALALRQDSVFTKRETIEKVAKAALEIGQPWMALEAAKVYDGSTFTKREWIEGAAKKAIAQGDKYTATQATKLVDWSSFTQRDLYKAIAEMP